MRALAAAFLLAAAGAQQPPGTPAFTPDTTVHIDASVSDARGRFLDALTVNDFVLAEDGVPQTIESVRLVRADRAGGTRAREMADAQTNLPPDGAVGSRTDERAAARQPGVRLFALYLDEYHVTAEGAERIRPALTRFVDELGPADLLVVMKPLESILHIRLSGDRQAARETIATFSGRKGNYEPRSQYEREFMASTPAAIDQARMQVTLSALEALAVHLGWASDARKSLIVVTGELAPTQRRRGLTLPTIESITRAANRFNVAVYPIDPGSDGADADGANGSGQDALTRIAAETDGAAIRAADEPSGGFRRIMADASAYYLISYKSQKKIDGKFHEIQLRVKRPGAHVRTRPGYWAMSPDELMSAELAARAAMPKKPPVVEPPRHISALIRPWFGLSRGDGGKTRVTFVWEPVRTLGDRNRRVAARIAFTALGPDDAPVFQGEVLPTGAGAVDGDRGPLRAVFDVPPGSVRLRMTIQDAASRAIDSDVRDISVRNLSGPVVLATPEVLRARNAREFRDLWADPHAAPVAAREFSRTERLLIRVRAYGASGERPVVSARLLSRLGHPMRELAVAPGATSDAPDRIDVSLAPFAAGEYIVELKATTSTGETKELLNFRVTN
jgi:VWFA-related protein